MRYYSVSGFELLSDPAVIAVYHDTVFSWLHMSTICPLSKLIPRSLFQEWFAMFQPTVQSYIPDMFLFSEQSLHLILYTTYSGQHHGNKSIFAGREFLL